MRSGGNSFGLVSGATGGGAYGSVDGLSSASSFSYSGGNGVGGYGMMMQGYAVGGAIDGPGTGTSDSIVIRASKGEYMQTADAHAYYGTAFMDEVRAKRLPRFASGGPINGSYGGVSGGATAPQIIVEDHNNNAVKSSSSQQSDGRWMIRLVLDAVSNDIVRGGQTSKALETRYGMSRRGVPVGS